LSQSSLQPYGPAPSGDERYELPEFPEYEDKISGGFWMPTRSWEQEFGWIIKPNERRLYVTTSLGYNAEQERSFPGKEQFDAFFDVDGAQERRARKGAASLGLLEWWYGPFRNRQNKLCFAKFFRMPYVKSKGYHMGTRQQPSADELLKARASGTLPDKYSWLRHKNTELLSPRFTEEQIADEIARRLGRWSHQRGRDSDSGGGSEGEG
jgi:hypothetical protein